LLAYAKDDIPNIQNVRILIQDIEDVRSVKTRAGLRANLDPSTFVVHLNNLTAIDIASIRHTVCNVLNYFYDMSKVGQEIRNKQQKPNQRPPIRTQSHTNIKSLQHLRNHMDEEKELELDNHNNNSPLANQKKTKNNSSGLIDSQNNISNFVANTVTNFQPRLQEPSEIDNDENENTLNQNKNDNQNANDNDNAQPRVRKLRRTR